MAKKTIHQEIWRRTKNDLKIVVPKKINSDIGFQLMFGPVEDYGYEQRIIKAHHDKYGARTYSKEDIKLWFL